MSTDASVAETKHRQFPCNHCGANLVFNPGQSALTCPYCGAVNQIQAPTDTVEELDYQQQLAQLTTDEGTVETLAVHCTTCGASSTLPPNVSASRCPFCGGAIVAEAATRRVIKPRSLLPFHVQRKHAESQFRNWIASLWFAPSGLAAAAEAGSLNGAYLPFWTYDAFTRSPYTGQRGEDYWETETYTEIVDGKPQTRTRQVQRTRWWPVSGQVEVPFDDLLIPATRSLPQKLLANLEPWDLQDLTPYKDEYLAGFVAQIYDVKLEEGFDAARSIMATAIEQAIRQDIGGDHQRITSVHTQYFNVTFKHLLLPVWLSAYRYQDKTYRFLINARTGEVQGERPWSWLKITLLVLLIAAMILAAVMLAQGR